MVGIVHHVGSYHGGEAVYSTYSALGIQTETVNELVSVVFKLLMKNQHLHVGVQRACEPGAL